MKAIIDDQSETFTLINTFEVATGQGAAVVNSLSLFTDETARHLEGFVGASVHVSLDGSRVVNYVQWRTAQHLAAMLALPASKAHMDEVRSLSLSVNPVPYAVKFVRAAAVD